MKIENPSKEYHKVEHRVYSCQYHVIFCPKYRRNVLTGDIVTSLKKLILKNQSKFKYSIIEIEIMPDHVHILIDVDPKIGIHSVITKIKGLTSRILRKKYKELTTKLPTLWTRSSFISSVGSVSLETVKKYIEDQKGV